MKKLEQTDNRLGPGYSKYGCNFLAHLGLAQSRTRYYLSIEQTMNIGYHLQGAGQLTDQLVLDKPTSPYALFKYAFFIMDYPKLRGEQVGRIQNGVIAFWNHVTEHVFDGVIAHLVNITGVSHYVECDRDFRVVYNPHPWFCGNKVEKYLLYRFWEAD